MAARRALVLGLASDIAVDVIAPLRAAGYEVRLGTPASLDREPCDVVVAGMGLPGSGAAELLARLGTRPCPLLVIAREEDLAQLPGGAPIGVVLTYPFEPPELVERVQRLAGSVPRASDPSSLLHAAAPLVLAEMEAWQERARRGESPGGFVACVRLHELSVAQGPFPKALRVEAASHAADLLQLDALGDETAAITDEAELLVLMPASRANEVQERLRVFRDRVAGRRIWLAGQLVQLSPVIGFAALADARNADRVVQCAREAAEAAASHFDLEPRRYSTAVARPKGPRWAAFAAWEQRHRVLLQYAQTSVYGLGVPFLVYWALDSIGIDISEGVYLFVVAALALTALFIWIESFLAVRRRDPPEEPASAYPPASAIIAAYLPNEAPIIEDTIAAFLRLRYPAPLQVILAYNTPKPMEIEVRLQEIARDHPNFIPMRVHGSTSKAQNVNAALPYVTGKFTAVFDADHQPDPDNFRRAWRWLSHGADVVQGHCLIRNGGDSWVARMIAVEFENIYAVSHPGRSRLHGFGIFGGSNGYWKTELLWRLRMHGFMLTEDIDSSMRAVVSGRRIVSDPYAVSRELAPTTMNALMKQRLRWAQGWFQISKKWIVPGMRSPRLTFRQKLGMLHLLAWREIYPWIAMQIVPLIAFWALKAGGLDKLDWFVPIFVVTTLFTLSTGPGQVLFTYALADPQVKRHRAWFWFYVLAGVAFYAGLKNAWARIAQLKEAQGETAWVVTSRVKPK